MFRAKYRIRTSEGGHFKVQIKLWYWPWWVEASGFRAGKFGCSSVMTLEQARALIRSHQDGTLGQNPFVPAVVETYE